MTSFHNKKLIEGVVCVIGMASVLTINAMAQYPGGGGGSTGGGMTGGGTTGGGTTAGGIMGGGTAGGGVATGGPATIYNFTSNYHIGFDRPEAWGLKYFASASLMSGLQPPPPAEGYHVGSVTVGLELGWLPTLDAGQRQIGFGGQVPEDLNKAPVFIRPIVRVGLPDKFTAFVAAPPPVEVFGITPRIFAFGLERPILERPQWTLGWRGYGQLGWVKGAFTCTNSALAFPPGSAGNPTECLAESQDVASLRYAGSEFQFAYKIPSHPKFVPHVAVGGSFIDGVFHVNAQVQDGLDRTRLWTRGGIFSTTGGITYLVTKRAAFTVDVFYSPLWVQRQPGAPTTNDGLFNVRAMLSYNLR